MCVPLCIPHYRWKPFPNNLLSRKNYGGGGGKCQSLPLPVYHWVQPYCCWWVPLFWYSHCFPPSPSSWDFSFDMHVIWSCSRSGILYIMWLNISQSPPPATPDTPSSNHHKKHLRMSVDCGGANRGLFFGIFTLVGTIISLIIFFVLVDKPGYTVSAAMVVHFSEIALYLLALIAVIAAAIKIRKLRFNPKHADPLDSILIIVSVVGIYVYGIFSIVAGRYGDNTIGGIFAMATNSLIMLQATVQTVFILNGLKRSPRNVYQETKRPGREFVTFLLVCNIGMWGINTFEILRADSNPLALRFYGHLPWSIITHISTPLAIFYRFHSTVCLSAIWKNAYKQKLTWSVSFPILHFPEFWCLVHRTQFSVQANM